MHDRLSCVAIARVDAASDLDRWALLRRRTIAVMFLRSALL